MSDRIENERIISTMGFVSRYYTDSFSRGAGVPVIGISRHRMGIDGKGITTLVAFHGCPLRCKYCLNPQCFGPAGNLPRFTPENLYAELQKDDLYFRATGGGVTFGGGEPCLQADFIVRFREICGPDWKINVETSLNVDSTLVEKLAPVVDEWIVDVKTDNQMKYNEYTGGSMNRVRNNLFRLQHRYNVPAERIVLRIPIIPGFIDAEQAEETRSRYESWGFTRFDVFTYRTEIIGKDNKATEDLDNGKAKCNILRKVREEIAEQIGSATLPPYNCTHTGNCPGTCPRCESELELLGRDRQERDNRPLQISPELSQRLDSFGETADNNQEEPELLGDIMEPSNLKETLLISLPRFIKRYFSRNNPVVQRPDLLRAQWLDDDSYGKMLTELKERGFATFRWGGYPPEETNLPEAGDKIVMLHEDKENVIIHLMHVLMTDEDCLKLGIDPDELYAVDDCIHFALTNVSGPINIDRNQLTFLSSDLKNYSVQEYLSIDETVAFKQMFGITRAINNQD